jgi:hypothetical protein
MSSLREVAARDARELGATGQPEDRAAVWFAMTYCGEDRPETRTHVEYNPKNDAYDASVEPNDPEEPLDVKQARELAHCLNRVFNTPKNTQEKEIQNAIGGRKPLIRWSDVEPAAP